VNQLTLNIINRYNNSPQELQTSGIKWYLKAHDFCLSISQIYNMNLDLVVGVLAALSPRNKWESNKEDCITIIKAYIKGVKLDEFKVRTFNTNKQKAWDILVTEQVNLRGNKVRAFYENIRYPDKSKDITIDTWAARVAHNDMNYKKPINNKDYQIISKAYLEAFEEISKSHKYLQTPMQVQAVCWEYIRSST
jgi:hypothetical protein